MKENGGKPAWGGDSTKKVDYKYVVVMKVKNQAPVSANSTNSTDSTAEPSVADLDATSSNSSNSTNSTEDSDLTETGSEEGSSEASSTTEEKEESSFSYSRTGSADLDKVKKVEEKKKQKKKGPRWKPPTDFRKKRAAHVPVILGLKGISRSGKVKINFNQKLRIPKRFRKKTRKLSAGGDDIFEISLANKDGEISAFKHDITDWTEDGISMQLDFDSPIEVSAQSLALAKINVKKPELFVSKDTGQALKQIGKEPIHFIKLVPRQIPKDINEDDLNRAAHAASLILLAMVIIQLNIAFWLNAELHLFWTFLSMLQIVVYTPIIKVNLPPNAEVHLEAMRHIAEFEPWDSHSLVTAIASIFGIPEYISKNPNAEDYRNAGFRSLYFWDNMKYILFLFSCFLFVCLIIFICSFFERCEPRSSKMLKKIQRKWTFSNLIRMTSVIFLYTVIAFTIAIQGADKPFVYTVGSMLILYPIWTAFFLLCNRAQLTNRGFLERYWALFGHLKSKETAALLYPFISCARKIIFVAGAVLLTEWSYFQVQLFTLLNMFYSIYFAYFHPNARVMDFRLELFNEWAIQIMCFHLMCFSDMVQLTTEPLINYKLGESFKIFASIVVVVNLVVFGHSLVGPVRAYLKRRKFRKALPSLIEQRMKQREGDTQKANAALQNKIDSIMNNF